MSIKFSIVTVAKGRYETFSRACDAIWSLAYDPNSVEHIVVYDHGDDGMESFISKYIDKYPNRKIIGAGIHLEDYDNRNMHRDYWNVGAKMAEGDVVFGLCNDTVITTQNYDSIILTEVERFKEYFGHDVLQILVDDDSGKIEEYPVNWFCSWIVLTKSAVECMNGLAPEELPFQGADRAVYQIFSQTIYPSQINLKHIIHTEHISHYTGRAEVDEITRHRPKNFNRPCILSPSQMQSYINKVNLQIQNQKF